jgi:hypothetical protein
MAKTTYQSYTDETPGDIYRSCFIRRGAMCAALSKRYPALAPIGAEADAIVTQMDAKFAALQQAEDDQIRARAVEDAEKLDLVDVYTELRRTLFAKKVDVQTLLPDAPSAIGRLNAKEFGERMSVAIANLKTLPDGDPQKATFLPLLEKESAEFDLADKAEDETRRNLQSGRTALLLYKAELSQVRMAQLGAIQNVLRDREKTALFTVPWRKTSKGGAAETEEEATQEPAEQPKPTATASEPSAQPKPATTATEPAEQPKPAATATEPTVQPKPTTGTLGPAAPLKPATSTSSDAGSSSDA